jgi:hypothetical protein
MDRQSLCIDRQSVCTDRKNVFTDRKNVCTDRQNFARIAKAFARIVKGFARIAKDYDELKQIFYLLSLYSLYFFEKIFAIRAKKFLRFVPCIRIALWLRKILHN